MSDSLHELWLRGVAFNPAAPSDVLIRLMHEAAVELGRLMCKNRDLPDAVIDAALRHPEWRIRGALAGNQHVDPSRLAPLATDPSGLVRARLAHPRRRSWPRWVRLLPDDIILALLTARDGGEDGRLTANEIISELDSSRQMPLSFFRSLADYEDPALRIRAMWRWESLTPAQRARLLDDPDPEVREAAHDRNWKLDPERVEAELPSLRPGSRPYVLDTCALSPALVEQCFADDTVRPLARNPHTPADAVARLARHPEAKVRELVAARPDLGPDLVAELGEDPSEDVRMRVRLHPFPRTWAEYEVIDLVVGHCPGCGCPITEPDPDPATVPTPDWFAACAVSREVVLRRVAASWSRLPAELVRTLAQDDDEGVRVRLALNHPLAPPHLLLDTFVTRPKDRADLVTLPGFPRTGRTHLIDHPDPEVRALAAADPTLPDPPVDDPDEQVRRAAAANPILTPEALEPLLADSRTAEGAAANPSLPASRMRALLDRCLHGAGT
ncbi:hypothetical protein [Streptomyces sp. NPDC057695]|uniref:hypothetical protein n=1 Tax=Streptomyces sp. NPDC057695 TaxID=3346217 RepID=UPI0036A5AA27